MMLFSNNNETTCKACEDENNTMRMHEDYPNNPTAMAMQRNTAAMHVLWMDGDIQTAVTLLQQAHTYVQQQEEEDEGIHHAHHSVRCKLSFLELEPVLEAPSVPQSYAEGHDSSHVDFHVHRQVMLMEEPIEDDDDQEEDNDETILLNLPMAKVVLAYNLGMVWHAAALPQGQSPQSRLWFRFARSWYQSALLGLKQHQDAEGSSGDLQIVLRVARQSQVWSQLHSTLFSNLGHVACLLQDRLCQEICANHLPLSLSSASASASASASSESSLQPQHQRQDTNAVSPLAPAA